MILGLLALWQFGGWWVKLAILLIFACAIAFSVCLGALFHDIGIHLAP